MRRLPLVTRKMVLGLLAAALAIAALGWLAWRPPDGAAAAAPIVTPASPTESTPEATLHEVEAAATRPAATEVGAPAPDSARREATEPAAWSHTMSGRVVDALTGEGLGDVLVQFRPTGSQRDSSVITDEGGHFASTVAYEGGLIHLRARCVLNGDEIGKTSRLHRPAEGKQGPPNAQTWELEVGPMFRVTVVGGPLGARWSLQLVERALDGEERVWPTLPADTVSPGGETLGRYTRWHHPPDPDWQPFLTVANEYGTWLGETNLPSIPGVHTLRVFVSPGTSAVHGVVVDRDGAPVEAAIFVVPRGSANSMYEDWSRTEANEEGAYEVRDLRPGPTRVLVSSDHRNIARADFELTAGEERELDFTLESLRIAGPVRGELVGPHDGGKPFAFVRCESLDGGATDLLEFSGSFWGGDTGGRAPFEFQDLPAGRYRLTVVSIDGRRYEPASRIVSPPTEDALFTTSSSMVEESLYDFEVIVRDAASGARLERTAQLYHLDPFWAAEVEVGSPADEFSEVPPDFPLSMVIGAPGYRPTFVRVSDAEPFEGRMRLVVDLQPGWGAGLVVLDGERMMGGAEASMDDILPLPGLQGARVLAGGREVGLSDARGLALCASAEPMRDVQVVLPGWTMLSVIRFQGHDTTPDGIGLVMMARE